MKPLLFEWDEAKNTVNRRKHGVSFDEARTVFADELARLLPDPVIRSAKKGSSCWE